MLLHKCQNSSRTEHVSVGAIFVTLITNLKLALETPRNVFSNRTARIAETKCDFKKFYFARVHHLPFFQRKGPTC